MRRTQLFGLGGLLCLLLGSLIPFGGINQARAVHGDAPIINFVSDCVDSPDNCRFPVKYLGENNGCACFSCEYGKKTQHIICTANDKDKATLMAQIRKQ